MCRRSISSRSRRSKNTEDLKGKALGITRYGASTDVSLRSYLKKYGLEPDREVKILAMGGQPEILAGMQAGVIQGGILSSPADFKAKKAGFALLANFAKEGIDYPNDKPGFDPFDDQKRSRNRKAIFDGL